MNYIIVLSIIAIIALSVIAFIKIKKCKRKVAPFPLGKPAVIDVFEEKPIIITRKIAALKNDAYRVAKRPFDLHVIYVHQDVYLQIDKQVFLKDGDADLMIFDVVSRVGTTHEFVDAGIRCYSIRRCRHLTIDISFDHVEQEQDYICSILKKGKTIEYV